jgi:hypothetical protein
VGSTLYTIVQGFGEHQHIVLPSKLIQHLLLELKADAIECELLVTYHNSLLHVAKSLKLKTLWPKGAVK